MSTPSTSSKVSSRSESPSPAPLVSTSEGCQGHHKISAYESASSDDALVLQRDDVYERAMSWWRVGIRRKLMEHVRTESEIIARMQNKIRSPRLDAYFVYTSSLGTHTFFMILLPAFFFFGYGEIARGLITLLAFGIYFSSFMKDLICSPRPFAPPVTRLTIGTHHLEYGFPSTHSTNSVSIALFFFAIFHRLASPHLSLDNSTTSIISPELYYALYFILIFYAFSIVFGRLYTAMHSFTDCLVGVLLGAGVWWAHTDWSGFALVIHSSSLLYQPILHLGLRSIYPPNSEFLVVRLGEGFCLGRKLEQWVQRGGWDVPLMLIPLTLLAVHKHPQPVDDCPCFEDAIAILSVLMGVFLSHWVVCFTGSGGAKWVKETVMPGSGWLFEAGKWIQVERGWKDVLIWWSIAAFKMFFGILTIFAWRIFAKSALHLILPPTFRFLARFFRLPKRRFYTPATEYKSVPSDFHSNGSGGFYLHPIPSMIELPTSVGVGVEVGGIGSSVKGVNINGNGSGVLKMRNSGALVGGPTGESIVTSGELHKNRIDDKESRGKGGESEQVKHYDADVLTKVIVYAGIAILASEVIPSIFDILGLGVKYWVDL